MNKKVSTQVSTVSTQPPVPVELVVRHDPEPEVTLSPAQIEALNAEKALLVRQLEAQGQAGDAAIHGTRSHLDPMPASKSVTEDEDDLISQAQRVLDRKAPNAREVYVAKQIGLIRDNLGGLCEMAQQEIGALEISIAKSKAVIDFCVSNTVGRLAVRRLVMPGEEAHLRGTFEVLSSAAAVLKSLQNGLAEVPRLLTLGDVSDASYLASQLNNRLQASLGYAARVDDAAKTVRRFLKELPQRVQDRGGDFPGSILDAPAPGKQGPMATMATVEVSRDPRDS